MENTALWKKHKNKTKLCAENMDQTLVCSVYAYFCLFGFDHCEWGCKDPLSKGATALLGFELGTSCMEVCSLIHSATTAPQTKQALSKPHIFNSLYFLLYLYFRDVCLVCLLDICIAFFLIWLNRMCLFIREIKEIYILLDLILWQHSPT